MGIFDFFSSKTDREKLSHIKELVALAMVDGKVEKSELAAIAAVCSREGISESEIKKFLDNPDSVDFVQPKSDHQRLLYLRDMCALMMVDGNIDENEFVLCKMAAESLGFRHEIVDAMVMDIINELKAKIEE